MKLVIDRKRWLRGESALQSSLLRRKDKKMCCFGFLALACGAEESEILEKPNPSNVAKYKWAKKDEFKWTVKPSEFSDVSFNISKSARLAMRLNDITNLSASPDFLREIELTKIFSDEGIELEFIN